VIVDDFSQDRLASDYVVHQAMQVANGVLRDTTATSLDEVITHNDSAGLVDSEVTLQVNFKSNAENGTTAAIVKFRGPGDFLPLGTTYSSSSIKVSKWENGVRTDLLHVAGLFTLSPNTTYWVRARITGNVTTVQLWRSDPARGGSPWVARSYMLTGRTPRSSGPALPGARGFTLIRTTPSASSTTCASPRSRRAAAVGAARAPRLQSPNRAALAVGTARLHQKPPRTAPAKHGRWVPRALTC
jgi:hypothetical protein